MGRRCPIGNPLSVIGRGCCGKICDGAVVYRPGQPYYRNETPPMSADFPENALELRSLVTSQGTPELSLHHVPVPTPGANEVLVRVEASPINPSDLGLLLAGADMTTATVAGTPERPTVTASLGAGALGGLFGAHRQTASGGYRGCGHRHSHGALAHGSGPAGKEGRDRGRRDVRAVPSG